VQIISGNYFQQHNDGMETKRVGMGWGQG